MGQGGRTRPGAVTGAVWALVTGAVMLGAGGLMTAGVSFDTLRQLAPGSVPDESVRSSLWLYRGAGILFTAAAAGLLSLALGARRRDPRSRRAAMALGLVVVVLVALAAVLVGTHILVLLSLLPLVVGVLLLSRPAVLTWYSGRDDAEALDDE